MFIPDSRVSQLYTDLSQITLPKLYPDFINLKSTALNFIWVLADMIEVGIMIASDVPRDKCILVAISKSITVKA